MKNKIEMLNGKKQHQFMGITYPNVCKMRPKKQIVKVVCNSDLFIVRMNIHPKVLKTTTKSVIIGQKFGDIPTYCSCNDVCKKF